MHVQFTFGAKADVQLQLLPLAAQEGESVSSEDVLLIAAPPQVPAPLQVSGPVHEFPSLQDVPEFLGVYVQLPALHIPTEL